MRRRSWAALAVLTLIPFTLVTALSATAEATPTTQPTPTSQPAQPTPPTPTTQVKQTTATTTPTSGMTISQPQSGETIVNTRLQVSGTAPPAWLVSVSIIDTDLGRTEIAHQPNGRVDGSVTSDASGHWVFVPPVKMTPGKFDVSASYIASNNQVVDSPTVQFVVVNESGESSIPSSSLKWKVLLIGMFVLVAIGGTVVYRRSRRGRASNDPPVARPRPASPEGSGPQAGAAASYVESTPLFMHTTDGRAYQRDQARKMAGLEREMKAIQSALVDSAEALERSNRAVAALRHQLHEQLAQLDPEPEVPTTVPERTAVRPPASAAGTLIS